MRARKSAHRHEAENHERWLVSYADFVTLLFAFFVVLYASSQVNQQKAQSVSDSVKRAYKEDHVLNLFQSMIGLRGKEGNPPPPPRAPSAKKDSEKAAPVGSEAAVAELVPSLESLGRVLQDEIKLGKIQVKMEARGLVITLQEAAFFPPGDSKVISETIPVIGKVAQAIGELSLPVRLEGHTDASPIQNVRFASNWDLSSARAIAMLNLMTQRFGLPPNRFAVAGYADTVPVDSNETAIGRAKNRRVEVVILNRYAIPYQSTAEKEKHH